MPWSQTSRAIRLPACVQRLRGRRKRQSAEDCYVRWPRAEHGRASVAAARYLLESVPVSLNRASHSNVAGCDQYSFLDQAYARRQMLSFVQDQYKPDQRMAVFTLTGSLNILQDFTTDPQILYAALQRFRPRPQEFASAGRATTSAAAGDATSGSTVASLDASTGPCDGYIGLGARGSAIGGGRASGSSEL